MGKPIRSRAPSWVEDSVTFSGTIRRSGNSLIITIPSELAKRFMISEGQEVMLVGMTRSVFSFEGMIGIYLGSFKVEEQVYGVSFSVEAESQPVDVEDLPFVQSVADKHGATSVEITKKDGGVSVKLLFGCIGDVPIKPKGKGDIEKIAQELAYEASKAGVTIKDLQILEERVEWSTVDPSTVARSPLKSSSRIKYGWEL